MGSLTSEKHSSGVATARSLLAVDHDRATAGNVERAGTAGPVVRGLSFAVGRGGGVVDGDPALVVGMVRQPQRGHVDAFQRGGQRARVVVMHTDRTHENVVQVNVGVDGARQDEKPRSVDDPIGGAVSTTRVSSSSARS